PGGEGAGGGEVAGAVAEQGPRAVAAVDDRGEVESAVAVEVGGTDLARVGRRGEEDRGGEGAAARAGQQEPVRAGGGGGHNVGPAVAVEIPDRQAGQLHAQGDVGPGRE